MKDEIFVKMALDAWQQQIAATDKLLNQLSDEQLAQEVAPGRNRGVYLLGHLAAVHDAMMPLLRFGEADLPEWRPIFIDSPDRAVAEIPSTGELRTQWKAINDKLASHFSGLTPDQWFERHANVSPDDFEKEPHRNRLNVLLSRTAHLSNHRGQLTFLAPRG